MLDKKNVLDPLVICHIYLFLFILCPLSYVLTLKHCWKNNVFALQYCSLSSIKSFKIYWKTTWSCFRMSEVFEGIQKVYAQNITFVPIVNICYPSICPKFLFILNFRPIVKKELFDYVQFFVDLEIYLILINIYNSWLVGVSLFLYIILQFKTICSWVASSLEWKRENKIKLKIRRMLFWSFPLTLGPRSKISILLIYFWPKRPWNKLLNHSFQGCFLPNK